MAKVGEIHELTLDTLAYGGKALGKLNGMAVFVPYGVPKDRIRPKPLPTLASWRVVLP